MNRPLTGLGLLAQALVLCAALALAGCAGETGVEIRAAANPAHVAASVGSARGADVAIASIEGAPDALAAKFSELLANAAAIREIPVTDGARAKYFVRGYLSAYPAEEGTAVGYVWDVFDGRKRLAKRVEDTIVIRARGKDSWSLVNEAVLNSLASRSADDLAVFLSGTPEAAAAKTAPEKPAETPLAYAPAQ